MMRYETEDITQEILVSDTRVLTVLFCTHFAWELFMYTRIINKNTY